jgi:hypothetical protein
MSFALLRISTIYHRHLRSPKGRVAEFAALRRSSSFICISSLLSMWSNRKEMHI